MKIITAPIQEDERLDALNKEIENRKSVFNHEIERKTVETQRGAAKIAEEQSLLNTQKREFNAMLIQFQKDKKALEKEREDLATIKKAHIELNEKVGRFMNLIKREAGLL